MKLKINRKLKMSVLLIVMIISWMIDGILARYIWGDINGWALLSSYCLGMITGIVLLSGYRLVE